MTLHRRVVLPIISRRADVSIADVSIELRYRNANTEKHVDCVAVPNIVSRLEWQARPPVDRVPLEVTPTPYVVIHHGGIAKRCYDQKACSEIVRSYQNYHMDDRQWFDIGYNFVIGEDGNVYEGRGWDYVGAHAPGYNTQSIGICVIGDFSGECGFSCIYAELKSGKCVRHVEYSTRGYISWLKRIPA